MKSYKELMKQVNNLKPAKSYVHDSVEFRKLLTSFGYRSDKSSHEPQKDDINNKRAGDFVQHIRDNFPKHKEQPTREYDARHDVHGVPVLTTVRSRTSGLYGWSAEDYK